MRWFFKEAFTKTVRKPLKESVTARLSLLMCVGWIGYAAVFLIDNPFKSFEWRFHDYRNMETAVMIGILGAEKLSLDCIAAKGINLSNGCAYFSRPSPYWQGGGCYEKAPIKAEEYCYAAAERMVNYRDSEITKFIRSKVIEIVLYLLIIPIGIFFSMVWGIRPLIRWIHVPLGKDKGHKK